MKVSKIMQIIKKFLVLLRSPRSARTRSQNRLYWAVNLGALALWAVGLGLVSLYFASAAVEHWSALFLSYLHAPALLALNLLPVAALTALFWLLFNRAWAAVAGSGILVLGMSLVNYYKIVLRNDPFLAADVFLVSEAANMTGAYTLRVPLSVVLAVAGTAAAVFLAARLLRARMRSLRLRALLLALLLALSAAGLSAVVFNDSVYAATENIERNAWFLSRWSDRDQYVSRGFIYPFAHSMKTAVEKAPEGYDAQASRAYLESFSDDDIPDDRKVNVIAIMLEAYNDFSTLGLTFETDPYAYFHQLQEESIHGRLVTNIFAGGTIDTERSFVTGYPYMSEYRTDLPTYVSWLAGQGYYTEGGHPGYDWFYNRRNVARYFGFDNYYFYEDRYETPGDSLMHDDEFFADLLQLYRDHRAESDAPYFSFSVTYQNHGPYADDTLYDSGTVYYAADGCSPQARNILNNYFWGIRLTDQAIESLIESLRDDDAPVVVVLFGDHNPWLGDNSYVYDELGISLDRGTDTGFYNYYCTPYIIWANDRAKEVTGSDFQGDGGDFSPCFLMNRLFEACGWEGNAYMKAANAMRDRLDVIGRTGICRETDTGVLTTRLEGPLLEEYTRFKQLEYYMKHDY